ncbi:hypothetical protein [Microbacterium sp. NPDC058345]|uniref:hypothetical protein n=1 Tax=Microbacterium sp. NPDC058345 TaxID=3346455 RepID=UPI00364C42B9
MRRRRGRSRRGRLQHPLTRRLTAAALASYTVNTAYGAAVAAGALGTRRIRWLHHALFVVTSTLTALALLAAAIERRRAGFALLPAAAQLIALPATAGGTRRHATTALRAAPWFLIAAVMARR